MLSSDQRAGKKASTTKHEAISMFVSHIMDHGCDRTGPSIFFSRFWYLLRLYLFDTSFHGGFCNVMGGVDVFKNILGVIERRHHVLISALASLAENLTIMVHLVIVCTTGIF